MRVRRLRPSHRAYTGATALAAYTSRDNNSLGDGTGVFVQVGEEGALDARGLGGAQGSGLEVAGLAPRRGVHSLARPRPISSLVVDFLSMEKKVVEGGSTGCAADWELGEHRETHDYGF